MDEDEEIKRDVQSPLNADDHAADDDEETDDLADDLGRELPEEEVSTHPSMDTDVDPTEIYHQGLDGPADVDENEESLLGEEESDEE